MSDYNPHDRGGGGRRFGGRDSGGRSGSWGRDDTRTMFKATCANCGNPCEVPFRPSGDRPIYCSDCFEKMGKGTGNSRSNDRRDFGRPRFEDRRSYPATGGEGGQTNSLIIDQLRSMNVKLDKIVGLLEKPAVKTQTPKKKASEKKEDIEIKLTETPKVTSE